MSFQYGQFGTGFSVSVHSAKGLGETLKRDQNPLSRRYRGGKEVDIDD